MSLSVVVADCCCLCIPNAIQLYSFVHATYTLHVYNTHIQYMYQPILFTHTLACNDTKTNYGEMHARNETEPSYLSELGCMRVLDNNLYIYPYV